MLSQRAAIYLGDRASTARKRATRSGEDATAADNALIRVLVLDKNPRTPQQIENTLWIWPHRVAVAGNVKNAVEMCRHLEPVALIVSVDFPSDHAVSIIGALRTELPNAVIIALGTASDAESPGPILKLGANLVLTREELGRPTLYDLLVRLRAEADDERTKIYPSETSMALHWRESQMVGSLICDVKGTITSANECLAKWLNYPSALALNGKFVWRDVLNCPDDWKTWTAVAGDMTAMMHKSVTVMASNHQLLWMNVEIFAAPNSPTDIQMVFVDLSELAHLKGSFEGL